MEIQNKYMNVKLISATKGSGKFKDKSAEDIIAYAARVSSSKEMNEKFEDTSQLLKYCIKNKHWSIFETASMTMEIDTSKAIGIQLLRHRSFTFQEFSQRYSTVTDMEDIELRVQHKNNRQSSTDVISLVKPDLKEVFLNPELDIIPKHKTLTDEVLLHIKRSQELYQELLDNNIARECARMVLPMATKTTIYMTGSVRSWIHMIDIRDDSHAQKEAQLIAKEMKNIFIEELPSISKALGWTKK